MKRTEAFGAGSYNSHFICALSIKLHIVTLNILTCLRRCGRGVLRGAAFRQRPLSRLLINVLAGTRTLSPEGPVPKHLWRVCAYAQVFTLSFLPSSVSRLRGTREPPLHYGAIATGNCWIRIRCAEHHPLRGRLGETDCDRRESLERDTPVLRYIKV